MKKLFYNTIKDSTEERDIELVYPFHFSKKVLDRANTIEFNKVDLKYNFEEVDIDELSPKNYHNDFLKSQ